MHRREICPSAERFALVHRPVVAHASAAVGWCVEEFVVVEVECRFGLWKEALFGRSADCHSFSEGAAEEITAASARQLVGVRDNNVLLITYLLATFMGCLGC